jgi:hypothetical protein
MKLKHDNPLSRILSLSAGSEPPVKKTATQAERAEKFAEILRRLRSKTKIAKAAKEFVEELRASLEKKTAGALAVVLYRVRRVVAEKLGEKHPAIAMLCSEPVALAAGVNPKHVAGMSRADIRRLREHTRQRVLRFQHSQIAIPSPAAIVRRAVAVARMERYNNAGRFLWENTLAGLMLLTGRRPVELAMVGHFAPSKRGSQWASFSGQAKARGREVPPFDIPLLGLPYQEISNLVRRLRRHCPVFRDEKHCHNLVASNLHFAATDFFSDAISRAYDLRAVYARLTYHAFAPENCTDLAWFANVLGHIVLKDTDPSKSAERADTITAANYQRFYVPRRKIREAIALDRALPK